MASHPRHLLTELVKYVSAIVIFFLLIASKAEPAIVRLYFHDAILSAPSLPPPDSGWGPAYAYPYDIFVGNWTDYNTNFHTLDTLPPTGENPKWLFREWMGGGAEQFQGVARFGRVLSAGDQINLTTQNLTLQMSVGENFYGENAQLMLRIYIWRNGAEVARLLGDGNPGSTTPEAGHPILAFGYTVNNPDDTQTEICDTFGPSTIGDGQMSGTCACNCTYPTESWGGECDPDPTCISNCTPGRRLLNVTFGNAGSYVNGIPYLSDAVANGAKLFDWDSCNSSSAFANFTAQAGDILVIDIGMRKNQHHPQYESAAIGYDGTSSSDPLNALSYIEFDGVIQGVPANAVNGNCTAVLSSDLSLHIPIISFNGYYLWADTACVFGVDGGVTCRVTNYGAVNSADFSTCQASTISSDGKLHIPFGVYNNLSFNADFVYVPTKDGQVWFKLVSATEN